VPSTAGVPSSILPFGPPAPFHDGIACKAAYVFTDHPGANPSNSLDLSPTFFRRSRSRAKKRCWADRRSPWHTTRVMRIPDKWEHVVQPLNSRYGGYVTRALPFP